MTGRTEHRSVSSDSGSVLPILLAGLAFLAIFALTLVGSIQFLQQQRILNSKTDAIALELTENLMRPSDSSRQAANETLENQARQALAKFYNEQAPLDLRVSQEGEASVQVGYCEPSRTNFGALIWGGHAKVCAVSRASATH